MKPETKLKLKKIFPPLGMRIIKTAISLVIAMVLSDYAFKRIIPELNTNSICVFAILSVQDSVKGTWKFVFERLFGNIIGLATGFLFLFLFTVTGTTGTNGDIIEGNFVFFALVALGTIIAIYLCKMINRASASAVTIIVFLGIMFGASTESPYLNAVYTVLQMTLGIIIAVSVNMLILPPKQKTDDTGLPLNDDNSLPHAEKGIDLNHDMESDK